MTNLEKAIVFATEKHAGQMREGGEPYILHPLRVMFTVQINDIFNQVELENVMTAAVLHDVVEDTDIVISTIESVFGENVSELVDLMTRKPGQTYANYLIPIKKNFDARIIKLADIKDNSDSHSLSYCSNAANMIKRYARAEAFLRGWSEKF